jgi:hypothetical protein
LGAAFYSNASYPDALKVINLSGVSSVPFFLANSGRDQFNFNYTTGYTQPVAALPIAFMTEIAAEIPIYIALWQARFANYSVPGFKVCYFLNLLSTRTDSDSFIERSPRRIHCFGC